MRTVTAVLILFVAVTPAFSQTERSGNKTTAATASAPVPPPLPPDAKAALDLGLAAVKQQSWPLAIKYFAQAREKAPWDPTLLFDLGLAEAKAGGRELRALNWMNAYLALSPNAPNRSQVQQETAALDIAVQGQVAKLIDTARAMAAAVSDPSQQSNVVDSIAAAQVRMNDLPGALKTAELVVDTPQMGYRSSVYGFIAQVQAQEKSSIWDIQQTLRLVSDRYNSKQSSYSDVVSQLLNAGRFDDAVQIVGSFSAGWGTASAYGDIAEKRAAKGDTIGALKTVLLIPNLNQRSSALWQVARAASSAGDIQGALKAAGMSTDPYYQSLAYSTVASEQVLRHDVSGANQSIASAFQPVDQIHDQGASTMRPRALADIAIVQASTGNLREAFKTANKISDPGNKSDAFVKIAPYCKQFGDESALRKSEDSALRAARQIEDTQLQGWAFLAVAQEQSRRGDIGAARSSESLISLAWLKNEAESSVAEEEQKRNKIVTLNQQLQLAASDKEKADVEFYLTRADLAVDDVDAALKSAAMSGQMKETAYREIAAAQAGDGDIRGAMNSIGMLSETDDKIYALQQSVSSYQGKFHDDNMAKAALTQLSSLAEPAVRCTGGLSFSRISFNGTTSFVSDSLAVSIAAAGKITDPKQRFSCYRDIATREFELKDGSGFTQSWNLAIEIAKSISSDSDRLDALATLVQDAAGRNDVRGAVDLAHLIPDSDQHKDSALRSIAFAQASAGDLESALTTASSVRSGDKAQDFARINENFLNPWTNFADGHDSEMYIDFVGYVGGLKNKTTDARTLVYNLTSAANYLGGSLRAAHNVVHPTAGL